jgi:hypothetical protein
MITCAVLGAVSACYEDSSRPLQSESEEVVPPCSSADAGADADTDTEEGEDASTD